MGPQGKRILIAGIGNVFHGDDAFGVEVVRALGARSVPDEVHVADFGIRSYDLAFAMLDGYEAVVLVDAALRGKTPGSLFVLEADVDGAAAFGSVSGHAMNPQAVLSLVKMMGGYDGRVFVLGCEPATLESADGRISLSKPVRVAVDEAVDLAERLVAELLRRERSRVNLNN